jgi:hypothetical protein
MPSLQLTKIGYDKIVDAHSKGYKFSVTNVKFGDGTGYKPTAGDTGLHGNTLWSGLISNVDAITGEHLDFLCICPEHLGLSAVAIGEIGLYFMDGSTEVLLALGCYPNPFIKEPNVRFKTHAICLSPYISAAVDLTLTWTMSLPRVNYYGDLPNPERTGDNAYIVNHGFSSGGRIRPSMLTRYAVTDTGPMSWGLLNGSLYYDGLVKPLANNSFQLIGAPVTNIPPELIDFAFVYVYQGTGRTQCRAVGYNPQTLAFETLYEDFSVTVSSSTSPTTSSACDTAAAASIPIQVTNLDTTSRVMIWTAVRLEDTSGLVYQSRWDATQGYPPNPLRGQYWVIGTSGIIQGICYQVGDWLVYSGSGIWDKVDNTELPYLLYRGTWDASNGTAPPQYPVTYYWENLRQGHYWVISVRGTIDGTAYLIGDWIVWNGASWDRVNNFSNINLDLGHTSTINADMVDGHHTSDKVIGTVNSVDIYGDIPVNNGLLQTGLNAEMIGGKKLSEFATPIATPTVPGLVAIGTTSRLAIDATGVLKSNIPGSLVGDGSTSGWLDLGNGIILQWGTFIMSNVKHTVPFNLSFPINCMNVMITMNQDATPINVNWASVGLLTQANFTWNPSSWSGSAINGFWLAIGH